MMNDKTPISRFRVWLKNIPVEDPINKQMGALLQVMLIGLIVLFATATLVNLLLTTDPYEETLILGGLFSIIFAIPLILLRRGYFRLSIYFLIAPFLILAASGILASNLRSEAETLTFFTFAILLAGLLIDRTALVVIFAISAIIVLFFALREQDPALRLDYFAVAGNFILLNGLMSIFINYFGITLHNSLRASLLREEEISALNEQLHKQVAELERFTYMVSHDLRSPLVTIKGFIGMLSQDLKDNRPDKIQDDFKRISGATEKMEALLADLLELSRIGRIANPPIEIDSVRLVHDALDSVDARIRSRKVTVNVEPNLPKLYGDRIRLREVFENLIDNAAKYMGEQKDPIIKIGVRNQNDVLVFYVKDNGLGIEEQFKEKIFGLFEKLDATVEGTGIGLALVKRIIETHGGKIWVESEGLGQGSTFYFTIPDRRE